MGLTAMVVGSVSGFGMQMMNNALQKVPLSRSECCGRGGVSVSALLFDDDDVRIICDCRLPLPPSCYSLYILLKFGVALSG